MQLFVRSFQFDKSRSLLFTFHCLHTSQHVAASPFRCLSSSLFGSQIEKQQNVLQPNWTTWWNHACYTGILWLSALHCLQQLQAGACSTPTAQPFSLTQESHGTAPSGSVPSPQSPLSSICTYTHLLHAHFSANSALTAYFAHLHACHIHAWLKCHEKGVCRMSVISLHLAFSLLMSHSPLLFPHTSRPLPTTTSLTIPSTCSCRTFPS